MIYFQSQVDALVKAKEDQNNLLKSENERLRKEIEIEKRRADTAVDNILYAAGSTRITPNVTVPRPQFDDLLAKVSAGLASIGKDVEIKEESGAT